MLKLALHGCDLPYVCGGLSPGAAPLLPLLACLAMPAPLLPLFACLWSRVRQVRPSGTGRGAQLQ